jgi:hypothetical protein
MIASECEQMPSQASTGETFLTNTAMQSPSECTFTSHDQCEDLGEAFGVMRSISRKCERVRASARLPNFEIDTIPIYEG